jgi:hypothetical protein
MASYCFVEREDGFTVSAQPASFDLPEAEPWFVDLCYEYSGGRRKPVTIIRRPTYFEIEGSDVRYSLFALVIGAQKGPTPGIGIGK